MTMTEHYDDDDEGPWECSQCGDMTMNVNKCCDVCEHVMMRTIEDADDDEPISASYRHYRKK